MPTPIRPLPCPSCGALPPPEDVEAPVRWHWQGPHLAWRQESSHGSCCRADLYAVVVCSCGWQGPKVSGFNAMAGNSWEDPEKAAEAIAKWNLRSEPRAAPERVIWLRMEMEQAANGVS